MTGNSWWRAFQFARIVSGHVVRRFSGRGALTDRQVVLQAGQPTRIEGQLMVCFRKSGRTGRSASSELGMVQPIFGCRVWVIEGRGKVVLWDVEQLGMLLIT
jgi:hypothetical protein